MYIGDWMERGERYFPESLAVVDVAKGDAGRFSYREMNRRANRLAGFLRDEAAVAKGDRIGILAMNGVEFLDAFFACAKLGAVLVPFNWRSHPREIAELVYQTEPKVMLFGDDFRAGISEIAGLSACASVKTWLHLDGEGIEGSRPYTETVQAREARPVKNDAVEAEDIVCLLFTGGTTGLPKGAKISYRMIAWNTLNTVVHELARGDVTLTHTPMFHTGALFVYTLPLLTLGGTVVIMRKWTADDMLSLIEREKATVLFCVPTQYQMMMQSPRFESAKLASLRFLTSGGAPLPVPILRAYREKHGVVFKQGFGMTEFGPGIFSMDPEYAEAKAGSIGKPNYFIDARIVDDDNRPLPVGEVGELVLKGPSACSGYFNNPEASAASVDEEGWFHTGDMARVDEDGFYSIADRKKDMFISGGENVYPAEIEKVLYEHPAVAQVAVIGVPDEKWGEVGRAIVITKPGASATEEALLAHCRDHLAKYKVPKSVVFVEAMPISAAGKILKRELKETYAR
ncbi:acyl-CoA synthetase [Polyangium sorediatum]|uniref:Long-chain fatty acid--CoA ligase n=1 Tax=Polyangium sorediatum TaxID=889274 RepID=A0ABT6NRE4_9BACT|nr:long-chain fatty acid--CoA ligase [Polyangium sorediatum]MDI1430878.1 long-chain fatty acid--CoA ligase [Polyangium sorediatum]